MSDEAPSYVISLNSVDYSDFFTSLQCRRYVRSQLGTFSVSVSDDKFELLAELKKWQPVWFSIDGTKIFSGRIDKVLRHSDKKQDGHLTTVTGRDNAGPLQDIIFSKYYYRMKPEDIFTDLINVVYPSRKGTLDPTITLGTVHFHNDLQQVFTHNFDRISFWQAIEELCQDVEGEYASTPLFLDFWVDEDSTIHVTQTGELDLGIDVGGYGGDFIETSDWTEDGLPVKNDIWFWGDVKAGVLPLEMDSFWCIAQKKLAADPWTEGTSQYFGQIISPGTLLGHMTITDDSKSFSPGAQSIKIHMQGVSPHLDFYGWEMAMPFGDQTNDDFKVFGRGPLGHLNFYNNDVMDETMGQISQIQFAINSTDEFDMQLLLIDSNTPTPGAMLSQRLHYSPVSDVGGLPGSATQPPFPLWKVLKFPLGPTGGGTLWGGVQGILGYNVLTAPSFFNWADVVKIQFVVFPSSLLPTTIAYTDIFFDDLSFTKPLVAHGTPVPTDSVHSAIVTDATVNNYQIAQFRANQYRALLSEAQSYVDYLIFGRPDLQVGHTFTAEDEKVLIRESITGATKSGGYVTSVKAWKPI